MNVWKGIIAAMTVLILGLLYQIYRIGGWFPVVEVLVASGVAIAWGIYRENRGKRP
jgi:CHASE2 domain-containing sensor protein